LWEKDQKKIMSCWKPPQSVAAAVSHSIQNQHNNINREKKSRERDPKKVLWRFSIVVCGRLLFPIICLCLSILVTHRCHHPFFMLLYFLHFSLRAIPLLHQRQPWSLLHHLRCVLSNLRPLMDFLLHFFDEEVQGAFWGVWCQSA